MSKSLKRSIIIFIIFALIALGLVLSKGHIGSYALVKIEDSEEEIEEKLSSMEVNAEKLYISSVKKESTPITVTVDGEDVTEQAELESSDEAIIKIKDGEAVAVKDGKVKITATYEDLSKEIEMYAITPIKTMTFTSTSSSIRVGKDLQLKLQVKPSDASISTLTYTSSDENIATVNANGIVTGVSAGKVTITVYDSYTDMEKSVNLTIKK